MIDRTIGKSIKREKPNAIKINNKKLLTPKPMSTTRAFFSPTEKLRPKLVTNHIETWKIKYSSIQNIDFFKTL